MSPSRWLCRDKVTVLTLVGLLSAAAGAAAEPVVTRTRAGEDVRAFWTAQRLRDARPLPVPEVAAVADLSMEVTTFADVPAQDAVGEAVGGGLPLPGLELAPVRLFAPADVAHVEEAIGWIGEPASGTANGYFTSSRLVPVTADRIYPYRTVGKLFFTIPGQGNFFCSGAAIGRRLVATAGQCVHRGSGGSNGFYSNFLFVPAFRDGVAPFGSWPWAYAVAPTTWTQGNGKLPNAADYAIIEVQDLTINGAVRRLGDVVGFLGTQTQKLRPNHAHILAYASNFDAANKLHQVTAQSLRAAANNNVEYGSDLRGGSAGGPVIQDFGPGANLVKWIGALSWFNTNTGIKTQGIAIPDSRFTSVRNTACSHRAGNC
jgi:V8-like Glu-specific endopeptidase